MGFDINGFKKAFIEKVEKMVNGENSEFNNGKIDPHEQSIFTQELNKAVQNGEISEADAKAIFGLEISGTSSTPNSAPRRASGSGGDGNQPVVIVVENGSTLIINIDNSSNWQLTINITADVENMVKELIAAFKEGVGSINENNNALLAELKAYLTEENNNIFNLLFGLFDGLRKDNSMQLDALMAIIQALGDIGIKIDGAAQMINDTIKSEFNTLKKMLKNSSEQLDKLIALVEKNNASQEEQNEILMHILDTIKSLNGKLDSLSKQQKAQLDAILALIDQQGKTEQENFETVIALLEAIRLDNNNNNEALQNIYNAIVEGNTALLDMLTEINKKFSKYGDEIMAKLIEIANKEFNGGDVTVNVDVSAILDKLDAMIEQLVSIDKNTGDTANYSKQILDAINNLGISVTASLSAIIEAIGNDTTKLDKLIELLEQLDKNNTEQNKAILEAIEKLGVDISSSFSTLIEIGNTNNSLQETTNNLILALTEYIQKHPGGGTVAIDIDAIIEAINANGADMSQKLSELYGLISTLNANVVQGNNDVINAIAKLGTDIIAALSNIVVKLDPEKLDTLIDLLNKMDEHNAEHNKAILDAIAALGVDTSAILDALKNLKVNVTVEGGGGEGGSTDLSEVIEAINANGADISQKLSELFGLLVTLNANVVQGNTDNQTIAQRILEAIVNLGNITTGDGQPIDLDALMKILNDILEAIKNHEVIITIHTDGTIDCDGGIVHEGETNTWDNVMNARAMVFVDGDDDNSELTGVDSVATDKNKNTPVYDLSGRVVHGPLKPGTVYIQNGKKFIAK